MYQYSESNGALNDTELSVCRPYMYTAVTYGPEGYHGRFIDSSLSFSHSIVPVCLEVFSDLSLEDLFISRACEL